MARATGGRGDAPPPAALLIRDRKGRATCDRCGPRPPTEARCCPRCQREAQQGRRGGEGPGLGDRAQRKGAGREAPRPGSQARGPPSPPAVRPATRPFCPSGGRDQRLKFHLVTTRAPAHPGPLKLCGCPATAASGEPPGPRESSEKWGFWALATGGTLGQLPHPWGAPWGIRDRVS